MKKKPEYEYKNNIKVRLNGIQLDKLQLQLANADGNSRSYLILGHNIKAQLFGNSLCLLISPKIVVELYRQSILTTDKTTLYRIEILGWESECILSDIVYGEAYRVMPEEVVLFFEIINNTKESRILLESLVRDTIV
jgi:hypothetical protein